MRKKHLFRFNLIEIILAMGVVAIGMTAVMALLPPALNANRDATGDAVAVEAASQMIAYIDIQARFVNQETDADWKNGMEGCFVDETGKKELKNYSDDELSKTDGTPLPYQGFENFKGIGGGLYNYVLTEDGESYSAANVIVWREDIPVPNNFNNAGTYRPGYRFFIKVCWPGEAPADSTSRRERVFVYDVLRPAVN